MQSIVHAVQGEGAAGADDAVDAAIQDLSDLGSSFGVRLILVGHQQHLGSSDDAGVVDAASGVALELLAFFGGELHGQVLAHAVVCAEHMKFR
jgi:hypothetical protein